MMYSTTGQIKYDDSNDIDTLLLLLLSPAALELNGGDLLLYIAETVMMRRRG